MEHHFTATDVKLQSFNWIGELVLVSGTSQKSWLNWKNNNTDLTGGEVSEQRGSTWFSSWNMRR